MKTNQTKKSAKRKLLPAIAMLTTSAIMLSTATYAWFTMNREVEVTGLKMTATTSDALEISLGSISSTDSTISLTTPTTDDLSWKKSITIGSYYQSVGKMKPASSTNGVNIYYVDNVYNGGQNVADDATISAATTAKFTPYTTYAATNSLAQSDVKNDEGYYVDIPMWLRTTAYNNGSANTVYCKATITDGDRGTDNKLVNAVRVAIVPITSYANSAAFTSATLAMPETIADSAVDIFANDGEVYAKGLITFNSNTPAWSTTAISVKTAPAALTSFTLPSASENNYSGEGFIVRVWIEGESTSCLDATANQDWNIDLQFSLDEISTTTTG